MTLGTKRRTFETLCGFKITSARRWREDGGDLETGNRRLGGAVHWKTGGKPWLFVAWVWRKRPDVLRPLRTGFYKSQKAAVAAVERWLDLQEKR